ncbi:MAG: permease [archaeon]
MAKKCPVCGMDGTIPMHGEYFCSERCLRKYEKENKIPHSICIACGKESHPWYKEKVYIVSLVAVGILGASYFVEPLMPWRLAFLDYFRIIWWAILLGLGLGGAIDYFIPKEYISKYLSGTKRITVLYAVLLGFMMSACSHGILALSVQLYKKGASVPAVVAFLLASPWANLPVTILLFGFFGFKALYLVASAIVIAVITGFAYQALDGIGKMDRNPNSVKVSSGFSIRKDVRRRWAAYRKSPKQAGEMLSGVLMGCWSLTRMVVWWIIIGMMFAATARAFVPEHFFMRFMGASALGMLVTLTVATVIEICSEGSSPMAFEIFRQTGAFGNSFVFLMAGVATDYTEIGVLWSNIGRRTALWLPVITVPQILLLGYVFNFVL